MGDKLYGTRISLPSLDNLFGTETAGPSNGEPINLPISQLYPFRDHPFEIRDDEEMEKLVESIQEYGVLTPAIVRTRSGGGYELISGHRRHHAAALAHKKEIPCIIREMDDYEATIMMVDANIQREHIRPMEKARAYQMKMDALRQQGQRNDLTSNQVGRKLETAAIVGEIAGDSQGQVRRYIRLNYLIPELQDMVDQSQLKLTPAVELSYLQPDEQSEFFEYIDSMGCTPSLSQAMKLKSASKNEELTSEKLEEIMTSQHPSVPPREPNRSFPLSKVQHYFPKDYTDEQMTEQIIRIVQAYYRNQKRHER